jgi:hypothetical protein
MELERASIEAFCLSVGADIYAAFMIFLCFCFPDLIFVQCYVAPLFAPMMINEYAKTNYRHVSESRLL